GLTSLYLSDNQLTDVSVLKELKGLTSLDLANNRLSTVPIWLTQMNMPVRIENKYDFDCINLYDNPIENPPIEIIKQGNKAIQNYWHQLEEQGKDYLYEAKMLIVGEGESGKTTLAYKIQDINCPLPHINDRTKGITINTHQFPIPQKDNDPNRDFLLNIWDFGGQEIYHATHRFFLSKRSLYVLVADNRKDDTDFNYWLNIIELFAADSPIIIVLNEKGDVKRSINTSELRGRYPDNIKEILSINFKTAEENNTAVKQQRLKKIEQLITLIEDAAKFLPHIGEPVPARWIDVRTALENDQRNYIFREQFDEICRYHQITDTEDIDTLLGYLHDLGILLHFSENPLLRDRVILNPTWATNAVYKIFDDETIISKQGRFTRNDCSVLWADPQYHRVCDVLIELMKNFRLIYEIENTGNLVAAQMLTQNTPSYPWNSENNSLMQFRYDLFMPKGILWQFIVLMYRYIENHDWVWRNGVILRRDATRAEVIEKLSERRIYIRFSGYGIPEFRAIIADKLDEISDSFHKLHYEKMIPCNCSKCSNSKEPNFYEFSDLKNRKEKGKQTVECRYSFEDVIVRTLLEGFDPVKVKEEIQKDEQKARASQSTRTIKIFLASSQELKEDRDQFRILISAENDKYLKQGLYFKVELWENFIDAMSPTRLQDEYNKVVEESDIFVCLFYTKVGPYTNEEFEKAFATFKNTNRPFIYTYFKNAYIKTGNITDDINTMLKFKEKLKALGHFLTEYTDINDLKYQFSKQLEKLLPKLK
ncbi:hypothetical protein EH223_12385, partial [candidate division KSB1 bacterium]